MMAPFSKRLDQALRIGIVACFFATLASSNIDNDLEDLGVDLCPEVAFREHSEVENGPGNSQSSRPVTDIDNSDFSHLGSRESHYFAEEHLQLFEKLVKQQEAQVAQINSLATVLDSVVSKLVELLSSERKLEGQRASVTDDWSEPETYFKILDGSLKVGRKGAGSKEELESVEAGERDDSDILHEEGTVAHFIQKEEGFPCSSVDDQGKGNKGGEGSRFGGRTIARYQPSWSDYFHFLSAVKVDSNVSCLHILPHEGEDGVSRYVAVGDERGQVYLFRACGDSLLHHVTISSAPITSMLSYVWRSNETVLVTGHLDGAVLMHRICETPHYGPACGDEWHALSMDFMYSLVPPAGHGKVASSPSARGGKDSATGQKSLEGSKAVTNIEMYRVGKMRYILVSDSGGKIQVYRENGMLYGVAYSPSRPLAFLRTSNTQRLLFVTETGAGSLDLRNMTVRSGPCEGLNDSKVVTCTFDAAGRSKAYGFTVDGDLIQLALSGDTFHFKCQVGTKRKVHVEMPLVSLALKGYLLVSTSKHIHVYNTSQGGFGYASNCAGTTRPVVISSKEHISLSFGNTPVKHIDGPMMAGNREKLVVVGFGDGYVGIFISNLPVQKAGDFNAKLWSSPIFFSIVLMFIGWLYFSRKKEFGLFLNPDVGSGYTPSAPTPRLNYENGRAASGETREAVTERRQFTPPSSRLAGNQNSYAGPNFRAAVAEASSYSARREPLFSSANTIGELRH